MGSTNSSCNSSAVWMAIGIIGYFCSLSERHHLRGNAKASRWIKKQVSMQLPFANERIPVRRANYASFPWYEDFNDALECLERMEGDYGLVDAPNLFTTQVDGVFKEENLKPTLTDATLYVSHMRQTLELMVSAHMDYFKATAPMERLQWLRALLEKESAMM